MLSCRAAFRCFACSLLGTFEMLQRMNAQRIHRNRRIRTSLYTGVLGDYTFRLGPMHCLVLPQVWNLLWLYSSGWVMLCRKGMKASLSTFHWDADSFSTLWSFLSNFWITWKQMQNAQTSKIQVKQVASSNPSRILAAHPNMACMTCSSNCEAPNELHPACPRCRCGSALWFGNHAQGGHTLFPALARHWENWFDVDVLWCDCAYVRVSGLSALISTSFWNGV